jgi:hypothetical protein
MDLDKLNSMTKYPSIKTYHTIGEKGRLQEKLEIEFNETDKISLREKIDGVNGRIIMLQSGLYIIGSREELLYAKGDIIENKTLGIVKELKPNAEKEKLHSMQKDIIVLYLEVFGGKTTKNSKQYTENQLTGHRLFDIATIKNYEKILEMEIEQIANWRENNGQTFWNENNLIKTSEKHKIELAPKLTTTNTIPTGIKETYEWMKQIITETHAKLDSNGIGKPEGIVIRNNDRSKIVKLRFEDYERTLKAARFSGPL